MTKAAYYKEKGTVEVRTTHAVSPGNGEVQLYWSFPMHRDIPEGSGHRISEAVCRVVGTVAT